MDDEAWAEPGEWPVWTGGVRAERPGAAAAVVAASAGLDAPEGTAGASRAPGPAVPPTTSVTPVAAPRAPDPVPAVSWLPWADVAAGERTEQLRPARATASFDPPDPTAVHGPGAWLPAPPSERRAPDVPARSLVAVPVTLGSDVVARAAPSGAGVYLPPPAADARPVARMPAPEPVLPPWAGAPADRGGSRAASPAARAPRPARSGRVRVGQAVAALVFGGLAVLTISGPRWADERQPAPPAPTVAPVTAPAAVATAAAVDPAPATTEPRASATQTTQTTPIATTAGAPIDVATTVVATTATPGVAAGNACPSVGAVATDDAGTSLVCSTTTRAGQPYGNGRARWRVP
jgi:hypothetical protein